MQEENKRISFVQASKMYAEQESKPYKIYRKNTNEYNSIVNIMKNGITPKNDITAEIKQKKETTTDKLSDEYINTENTKIVKRQQKPKPKPKGSGKVDIDINKHVIDFS